MHIFYHFLILITIFWNVTMVKGTMNLVYMGKYPIYINEFSAYCTDLLAILSCTRTYIELMLHTRIIRWLHELLIPKKLLMQITSSINIHLKHIKLPIDLNLQNIFIQRIRCSLGPISKIKNCFLISLKNSQVQYRWW